MLSDSLSDVLARYKGLLAILSVILTLSLAYGTKNLYFESDYKIFFDADNPQLVQQDQIENEYTKSDNVTILVSNPERDLFNRRDLKTLVNMTREAWTLPYSIRVDSLTNFQNTYAEGDDMIVRDLVPETALDSDDAVLEQIRTTALNQPELVDFVLSRDGKTTSITILLQLPDDKIEKDQATFEAVRAARELVARYQKSNPNLQYYLLGQTTVNVTFNELSQRDSGFWFPIMFGVMALLLVLLLKSLTGMLITQIIIVTSVLSTLGLMGWMHVPLNQVTAALPVIILTLAVCDCVHILNNFYFHLYDHQDKHKALVNALKTNFTPVFLTTLTTAIGFLSMNYSDTPPLRELGTWAAVGVIFAWIYSLCLLPWLAEKLPATGRQEAAARWAPRYANWLNKHARILLFLCAGVVLGLISQIPKNELNDNTIGYFKESVPFRQAADFMQSHLTGFDNFNYSLHCNAPSCINDPEYLSKVERFVTWLKNQPEIVHVVSYTEVIKRLNRVMHQGDEKFYTIPDNRELAAQYQLLYELSLPFGLDLNNMINVDKSALKISAVIKGQKAQQLLELEDRIQHWLSDNLPDLASPGAGISLMFAHLGQRNIESMIEGSLVALLLVTLTLIIALKSVRYGLISLIPNSLPAAAAFGIWAIVMKEVNVAVAVVFSFTLGIIVDDTVHFLTKYLRAHREMNKPALAAIEYAVSIVGKPIIVTTVVLGVGFSVLALSDFNVNAYMGAMVAITIFLALLLDLILLPVSLLYLDNRKEPISRVTVESVS